MLCGLREGLRQHEQRHSLEDHEMLWNTTKGLENGQVMYTNCTSAVVDGDGRTDWFEVKSRVKQGCNMSGFLFLLVVD